MTRPPATMAAAMPVPRPRKIAGSAPASAPQRTSASAAAFTSVATTGSSPSPSRSAGRRASASQPGTFGARRTWSSSTMPGLVAPTPTHRLPLPAAVRPDSSSAAAIARSTACPAPRPASVSRRSPRSSRPSRPAVATSTFVPPKSIATTKSPPEGVELIGRDPSECDHAASRHLGGFLSNSSVGSAAVVGSEHQRPGRPRLLRAINERAVLARLRAAAPATRTELARDTGLSKPTVGLALAHLERAGLVREAGRRTGERGRSALLYEPDPLAALVVGVDVGRSWVRAAAADLSGTVLARRDERSRARSAAALIATVRELARAAVADTGLPWSRVAHAVVGSPGVLDAETGGVRFAPNLPGWARPGLVDELRGALVPGAELHNDVNLAALGERAYGHGRDVEDFVVLSVGTGVGMGIVIGGELHRGARGLAGEVGFLPLADGGVGAAGTRSRAVRRRGALEEAAAAGGVVRTGREMGMTGRLTAERIFAAAGRGEPTAVATVEREAERLAVVVAAVAAIVDPQLVILGGGIAESADVLLPPLARRLEELTPLAPPVVAGELGHDAIVLGAIATALETARERVFQERAGDGHA